MSHLVIEGLSKSYGPNTVVEDFTLSVEQGEFVSLLGPSGCGKTTTLQMIAGFVAPNAGRILLDGRDLAAVPANQRGLGIVFQTYALFPHMTAAQNIAFGLEMRKIGRAERDEKIREALTLVGLDALADRYPANMSGGQQQRVALARALVIQPQLLLLDEPLSNLDAKLREEMQSELRRIQSSVGTTTIMVTHDQAEALTLSDRIVVLNKGRIEQIATPVAAYDQPATAFVASFLGRSSYLSVNGSRVAVRPERLRFVDQSLGTISGRLESRTFLGAHWLCEVDVEGELVQILCAHDGSRIPSEGETVHLCHLSGRGPQADTGRAS